MQEMNNPNANSTILSPSLQSDSHQLPHMVTLKTSGRHQRDCILSERIRDYIFELSNLVAATCEARVAVFALDP